MSEKKSNDEIAVVVTTKHRGVFFGYTAKSAEDIVRDGIATLRDGRMCVQWSRDCRGVVGLAGVGPIGASRVTPASRSLTVNEVTGVWACTAAATAEWETGPWR